MIPNLEDCNPGLTPIGYNVLVALDVLEEKSVGGILLPTKHIERQDGAAEKGRIVAVSDMAFFGGDWVAIPSDKHPQIGNIVQFQRYAGAEFEGEDGKKYRIVSDTDLKGIFHGG